MAVYRPTQWTSEEIEKMLKSCPCKGGTTHGEEVVGKSTSHFQLVCAARPGGCDDYRECNRSGRDVIFDVTIKDDSKTLLASVDSWRKTSLSSLKEWWGQVTKK